MNLINFVKYLLEPEKLEEFYKEKDLDTNSEALLIYLQNELSVNSELFIFPIEQTEDDLLYEKNEIEYLQLFPVDYAIELLEFDLQLKDKGYSEKEIAERLIDYRKRDA